METTPKPQLYLREWRKMRGFGLRQLGFSIGVSESVLSRYERDERSLKVGILVKLAAAMGLHPGDLFSPPPNPPKSKA
jgi:transcriptional regulator with XRE-family HTH domain